MTAGRTENPPPAASALLAAPPPPVPAGPQEAVRCPLCDYDLRGLTEPRCPECGYRFVWADLTDPARRRHPYLFEHHPEHNLWSFARTLLAGLRPMRFWTSIHPAQRSRPRRLVFYWCAAASVFVAAVAAHYGLWFAQAADKAVVDRVRLRAIYPPDLFEEHVPLPFTPKFFENAWREEGWWTMHLACFWLAWPLLVFVTMLLFRVSMRRARIRPAQVLRCVLYSYDAVFWFGLVVLLAVGLRAMGWYRLLAPNSFIPRAPIPSDHVYQYRPDVVTDALFWAGGLYVLLAVYRLTVAFRHYLRFDHPLATVLSANAIVALALLLAAVRGWMP